MKLTFLLVSMTIIFWGLWGFFGKLAVNRIGIQASFWAGTMVILVITAYLLLSNQLFPIKSNFQGSSLAILAGLFSGLASVIFYILLAKHPAGFVVTVVALYPIVTILLSFIFLHEPLNLTRIIGFVFAIIAIFLLSL